MQSLQVQAVGLLQVLEAARFPQELVVGQSLQQAAQHLQQQEELHSRHLATQEGAPLVGVAQFLQQGEELLQMLEVVQQQQEQEVLHSRQMAMRVVAPLAVEVVAGAVRPLELQEEQRTSRPGGQWVAVVAGCRLQGQRGAAGPGQGGRGDRLRCRG